MIPRCNSRVFYRFFSRLRVYRLSAPLFLHLEMWYTEAMNIRRISLIVVALAFSVLLNLYLFAHALWKSAAPKLAVGDSCDESSVSSSPKVNPKKTFFINCGGFLE